MKIVIIDSQKLLSERATEQAKSKVASALSKFGYRVRSVEISVGDANGPRGGFDKSCRVMVQIKKMGAVIASVEEESLSKAVSRAMGRAERAVARRIQRQAFSDPGTRSEIGFAFYDRI